MFRNLSPLFSLNFNRKNFFALLSVCFVLIASAGFFVSRSVQATGEQVVISNIINDRNISEFGVVIDGELDTSFKNKIVDGTVYAVMIQSDGKIVIGGLFTSVHGRTRAALARLNADGTLDESFNADVSSTICQTSIQTIAIQPDGKIVVGGCFTSIGGQSRQYVARLNSNGSVDNSFTSVISSGPITTVELAPDGKILANIFDFSNSSYYVKRLNSDGSLDNSFNSTVGSVYVFEIQSDGKILIGGGFQSVNGNSSRKYIARLNSDGSTDTTFTCDVVSQGVYDVLVQANGQILFGGVITSVNGQPRTGVARVNANGTLDFTFNTSNTNFNSLRILLQPDGKIIVGGEYSIVRVNPNGSADNSFPLLSAFGRAMALQTNGKIVNGGGLGPNDCYYGVCLTRLNTDGTRDESLYALNLDNTVNVVKKYPGGKILVAGGFEHAGNRVVSSIIRLNPDATLDQTFTYTPQPQRVEANDMEVQPDGKILVGGNSSDGTGNPLKYLFRLNANGTLDQTFNTNLAASRIRDIEVLANGKILVSGSILVTVGSQSRGLVRLNSDGTYDNTFNTPNLADVFSISLQADGKILLAGGINYVANGQNRQYIARLNADGTDDATFVSNVVAGGQTPSIYRVKVQPDGKILICGQLAATIAGQQRNGVARLNPNGALDASFQNPNVTTPIVYDIELQPDGKILIGGEFSSVGGQTRDRLARINANGSLDTSFLDPNISLPNPFGTPAIVRDIELQEDNRILLAGTFSRVGSQPANGQPQQFIARLLNPSLQPSKAVFDFDGDGKTDISIFRPSLGQWWIQRSSNGTVPAYTFGTSSDKIVPADYTGDGKTDIAFFRPSTSQWFILRSEDNTFYAAPFGVSTDIPTPGDYDGDGKADIAVFRPSAGIWFILKSSDSGVLTVPFGVNQDIPVVADYDGDGKADVAIYRPNGSSGGGEWWILRSTAGVFATPFGSVTDKPVQGDYTGDGKADISFFRPSTGEWFILRSENLTFFAAPFGTTGDIPSAGDYDGDGKFDFAVFRPSSATWFILKSTGGTQIQAFGTTGDIPVPSAFIP